MQNPDRARNAPPHPKTAPPSVEYILIAPVVGSGGRPPENHETEPTQEMTTRRDFNPGFLKQSIVEVMASTTEGGVQLSSIEMRAVGGRVFAVASATIATETPKDTPALEKQLTDAMTYVVSNSKEGGAAPWVSRTKVVHRSAFDSNDPWMGKGARVKELELVAASDEPILVLAGWGNCIAVTDAPLSRSDFQEITSGMVDAQLIWGQMAALAEESARTVRRDGSGSPRQAVEDARRMSRQLAHDNLYYDEVLLRIQGNRLDVCAGLLSAWNYSEALSRLTRRVDEINALASHVMDHRMSRYQTLVEGILFVIGVSGLIQLVLAFIQTAYSGGTAAVPGETDALSTLRWLRTINLEAAIWLPTILSISLIAYILLVKRKDLDRE